MLPPPSRRTRRAPGGGGVWLSVFVFLPLVLLAGIGVRGLQLSKEAVRENAREEMAVAVRVAASEFTRGLHELRRGARIVALYSDVLVPAQLHEAAAEFVRATALPADQARPVLVRLAQEQPRARTEAGAPLLPLVEFARLRAERDAARLPERIDALGRAAVETAPSLLTPELLHRAETELAARDLPSGKLQAWRARWEHDEQLRALLRKDSQASAGLEGAAWLDEDAESWLFEHLDGAVRFIERTKLIELSKRAASAASAGRRYAGIDIDFAGTRLSASPFHSPPLATQQAGPLLIQGHVDEHQLYAMQRTQTFWLSALLGCAVLAEAGALWSIRRAWRREVQLGRLKDDFVSSVSHELRAPLASMRLMAENLESGSVNETERTREYHRLLAQESRRLATLVDNVLDFARIEQNRRVYHFVETDIAALVRDAAEIMKPQAAARRQEMVLDVAAFEPPVCDGIAVRQALLNLLDNASKFAPDGTAIRLGLRERDAQHWELGVADEGPGIPAGEHERIFERFYRVGDELRRGTQGSGIGLSIVRHIVEGHGGTIELVSRPGAGAHFTLVFPRTPLAAEPED